MSESQREQMRRIKRSSGRRRNDIVIRLALGALGLVAALSVFTTVLLFVQSRDDRSALKRSDAAVATANSAVAKADSALSALSQGQARQAVQLQEGCERFNVLRAATNTTSAATYTLFRSVAAFGFPAGRTATAGVLRFERALGSAVSHIDWTPLTDCVEAVAVNGAAYKAPPPVPFVLQRPPQSQLSVSNAQMPRPKGSLP